MGLVRSLGKLLTYSLALAGAATVAFVVLAYGWDGTPPTVSLEGSAESGE